MQKIYLGQASPRRPEGGGGQGRRSADQQQIGRSSLAGAPAAGRATTREADFGRTGCSRSQDRCLPVSADPAQPAAGGRRSSASRSATSSRSRLHDVNRFGQLRDFSGLANFAALVRRPDLPALHSAHLVWTVRWSAATVLLSVPVAMILERRFLRPRPCPRHHHAALGGVADHDGDRLALGAERRKRHAQRGAARARPDRTARSNGWPAPRPPSRCEIADRHPGHDAVHHDDLPRRAVVASRTTSTRRPRIDGRDARWQQLPRHHLAAAAPVHQHRHRAQHHLRLQFLPDHLGDDPGRAGQLAPTSWSPISTSSPSASASSARPSALSLVDVRDPAGLHASLYALLPCAASGRRHEPRRAAPQPRLTGCCCRR